MSDTRTAEASIREFLRIAERDTHAYHAATAALDRMVARIVELEERSPEGPWTADGAHCPTCDCGTPKPPVCAGCGKGIDRHHPIHGFCRDVDYSGGQRWDFERPGDSVDMAYADFKARWDAIRARAKKAKEKK